MLELLRHVGLTARLPAGLLAQTRIRANNDKKAATQHASMIDRVRNKSLGNVIEGRCLVECAYIRVRFS